MRLDRVITALTLLLLGTRAAAEEASICADRPSKSSGPCTVPQGKWQIETGLIDWNVQRSAGVTSAEVMWGNTAIKYGISSAADLELWVTPLATEQVHGGGAHAHAASFGDMLVRVKYALTDSRSPVEVALDPFIKIPTANHELGNGKVEAGLLLPVEVPLGRGPVTLSVDPELDLLADSDGAARHIATQQVINIGFAATDRLTLSTELWTMWDWDPQGTRKMASWDAAAAYDITPDVQLDAGANIGLNRETPDFEAYTGVSVRF